MGHRCGEHQTRRTNRALLGLLLAVAFLGHDLLMAGDAHLAAAAHRGHAAMAMHSAMPALPPAREADTKTSTAIDGCGFFRVAIPVPDDEGRTTGPPCAIFATAPELGVLADAFARHAEPTAPPGVRRALLQVFLI